MEWLNYHHLLYFWAVARHGSIVRASAELRLAEPTISGQIRRLESVLGEKLFDRVGRTLVLTEAGRTTFRYADEIFALGKDLLSTLKGRPTNRPLVLTVGVAGVFPRPLVLKLLEPAFHLDAPLRLMCHENRTVEDFLGDLVGQELDLVLADRPLGPGSKAHAFNHLLGECTTSILAKGPLATAARRDFPRTLETVPCLLPSRHASLRRELDSWFDAEHLRPNIAAEFDDSGLMYAFAEEGKGVFPVPTVFEEVLRRKYQAKVVGRVSAVKHQFFAISVERRIKHPAVMAIVEGARNDVFA